MGGSYLTRMLCCVAASLSLVLAAAHLPFRRGIDAVGWYVATADERIALELLDASTSSVQGIGALVTDFSGNDPTPEPVTDLDERQLPEPLPEAIRENTPVGKMTGLRVFNFVQTMPRIVGGVGAYYIHIEYPREALRKGIEGRLVLSFIVENDGRTSDISVAKSLHPICDSAAVRALRKTRFVPGEQDGSRVAVRMRLPVVFKLVDPAEIPAISDSS